MEYVMKKFVEVTMAFAYPSLRVYIYNLPASADQAVFSISVTPLAPSISKDETQKDIYYKFTLQAADEEQGLIAANLLFEAVKDTVIAANYYSLGNYKLIITAIGVPAYEGLSAAGQPMFAVNIALTTINE